MGGYVGQDHMHNKALTQIILLNPDMYYLLTVINHTTMVIE